MKNNLYSIDLKKNINIILLVYYWKHILDLAKLLISASNQSILTDFQNLGDSLHMFCKLEFTYNLFS